MSCLTQIVDCFTSTLEWIGLYEPEINIHQARNRLSKERVIWEKYQEDRTQRWNDFQANNTINKTPIPLVEKAIDHLKGHNIRKGVAVDLGCGISSSTFYLLNRGWKVYAVDSSEFVLQTLTQKVSNIRKKWIENGRLVLVKQSIEQFQYPDKVHLIIAIDSIPYCNPVELGNIFLRAKNALLPRGVLVCNLFPSSGSIADSMLRNIFGAWMTTKNVVEAVMKSVDFPSWSVIDGKSPSGIAKQFHILAEA